MNNIIKLSEYETSSEEEEYGEEEYSEEEQFEPNVEEDTEVQGNIHADDGFQINEDHHAGLSVYLSVYLSACLSFCLYIRLLVFMSTCIISVYLSV